MNDLTYVAKEAESEIKFKIKKMNEWNKMNEWTGITNKN